MKKYININSTSALIVLLVIVLASCSGTKSPVAPSDMVSDDQIPGVENPSESNRGVVAVYDPVIDPVAGTFVITPSERMVDYHFPLSQYYPNVLTITGYGFTPNFWADIKLTHPFPGSGIKAYDPRVIAILPARAGVSFNYPTLNAIGNNSVVLEPDGCMKLFDNLGGSIPGNTNPFKAYFKDQPYRVWSDTGVTSETQRWQMNLAGFGGPLQFKLVVDVSTNFPNPPTPVTDNAPEPVRITMRCGDLTPGGGSTTIEVTLLDWQGQATIGGVAVESPSIFNSVVFLPYSRPGPYPNEYIYSGTISNSLLAPEGEYSLLVASWNVDPNIFIYSEFPVMVQETIEFNPVDVTPPQLIFESFDVFISGNYAYIACGEYGLLIFEISEPLNPIYINRVNTPENANEVYVAGAYAYVADNAGLQIIDIVPPESAHIVKSVDTPDYAMGICYSSAYVYVAARNSGLQIIYVEPPEIAYVVKTVDTLWATDVYITGAYAYVVDHYLGLQIIDIEPPESAYIVKSFDTPGIACDVCVLGGYAYVADGSYGLQIIDIDPPESAYIVKSVDMPGYADGVYVSGAYAYVADSSHKLQIIDIAIPSMAYIVKTVDTPGDAIGVYVSGNYAYVADGLRGVQIIDIEWPGLAYIVKSIETTYKAWDIHVSSGYSYVANDYYGLQIIIEPPESAHIIKSVRGGGVWLGTGGNAIDISNGCAYLTCSASDILLRIIDIEPPESAYIVNEVATPTYAEDVNVSGAYAYVADSSYGLQIIDIEPPELAYIVKTISTSGNAKGVCVLGNYAYVADSSFGLHIIDIESPESAYIVKTVDTPGTEDVYISGDYAYVANGSAGLKIIDINPPGAAYIIKSVDTPGLAYGVYVSGGYAYVADENYGLQIIDILPPRSAYIVTSFDTPGSSKGVYVSGGYAYVADDEGGLRIIKLW